MTMWLNACLSKLLILFPRFIAHQKVVLFMLSFPCFLFLSLGMEILERYIIIIIIIVVPVTVIIIIITCNTSVSLYVPRDTQIAYSIYVCLDSTNFI